MECNPGTLTKENVEIYKKYGFENVGLRKKYYKGKYDAILMDPPSYGRGPGGEVWKLEEQIYPLVAECVKLLSDDPLFCLINSYTTGLAPSAVGYASDVVFSASHGGHTAVGEVGLPVKSTGYVLPCGATGRWTPDK